MRSDRSYEIISNKKLSSGFFELKIYAKKEASLCKAGQFFMINVPGVFLRRPISVHNSNKNTLSFLYKVVGKGTKILSTINKKIEMLGPLGNGYCLVSSSDNVVIAGGSGIASIFFLISKLSQKGVLYYGAKTKKDFVCIDRVKKLGWKIVLSTEDGSMGYKGLITDKFWIDYKGKDKPYIYVCGPIPMIKATAKVAKEFGLFGQVSLEEKMACGFGNCQGCAVCIDGKNKTVCKDGPVFNIKDIKI
ncbi:MAG: dihydroorotate dehydrogenase electron transfer subunit [Elusimicrobiota bacterium]|jgi:dihydroorotate dehydrogenase electron transfer subunit|nr:dihydroorotate dehydrogenase electron transfer subunit [Elusimicrobiota bacterium]